MKLNLWTKIISFLILLPVSFFLLSPTMLQVVAIFLVLSLVLFKISFLTFWKGIRSYTFGTLFGITVLSLLFTPGDYRTRLFEGLLLSERFILLISFGILFSTITNPIEFPT